MDGNEKHITQKSDSFGTAVFLILSGGFQDAYTYICRDGVFANAQTGNIVLLSRAVFGGNIHSVIKYLVPLLSFILGTLAAKFLHARLKNAKKLHWRQTVLLLESLLLFTVAVIPQTLNPLANAVVSFVCAMQLQTFRKILGHTYASTMCIGNMRSGTEALFDFLSTKDKSSLKKSATYFGVVLIFAVGAGAGCAFTALLGNRAILFSCVLLLMGFFTMFAKPQK